MRTEPAVGRSKPARIQPQIATAAERHFRLLAIQPVLRDRAQQIGIDRPRGDRVHSDVVGSNLVGEGAREDSDGEFIKRVGEQFEGDWKLRFHLAPPLFARRDKDGHLVKRSYGAGMLRVYRTHLPRFRHAANHRHLLGPTAAA